MVPTFDQLMDPLFKALKALGGSGRIDEIYKKVIEITNIPDEDLNTLHNPEEGGVTEVEYRLAWTRTYLKKYGLIVNSSRGVWALTPKGQNIDSLDSNEVVKFVRERDRRDREEGVEPVPTPAVDETWQSKLLETIKNIEPSAFERLIQRLLRESGFTQVEVTGRAGDGGIDGKGIMRVGGLLSFHVIFQCKRYRGSVTPSQIRDFRGAMIGRTDKGLFVTTGNFTKEAIQEATRDGAPPLDLMDGDQLADKLKELSLGVKTEIVQVEKVSIDTTWFNSI